MRFNRLVYTEARPANGIDRSMTVDFELEEITVVSPGGGVRWCRLGTHERSAVDAKLSSSRPEDWAEKYAAPLGDGLDWTLRLSEGDAEGKEVKDGGLRLNSSCPVKCAGRNEVANEVSVDWTLRLFDGTVLVKTSRGANAFPPADQWDAFRLLTDFCFTVTRRYGAPPQPM